MPVIIISGMAYSILAKKLTVAAAFTGAVIAITIFSAAGYSGLAMMTTFFILGSAATSWQRHKKHPLIKGEETGTGRNMMQVLANAGAAGIVGIVVIVYPQHSVLLLPVMAAAFASAAADTLSSELGMVYGRRFFNVISFKPDACGRDGVVSLEGTVIGILGSAIIAVIYAIGWGRGISFLFIVIAGTIGNITDSVLGALLERKGIIGNDAVNFLNTLVAAGVMLGLEVAFVSV
ncbi:DUF92 domain-containing protein [Pedobacter sp. BMA]|uniref:DUF92 domain-containing protein n=1 Tax=Pedobacter sp. BMA TaxID=1663685 RepID=UPI0018CD77D4|nr:DUF92 domain-containing protein [Pedobacter sp. BMA]